MSVKLEGISPYLAHFHAPPRERYDEGRSRRETVPLESHAETAAGPERADPPTTKHGPESRAAAHSAPVRADELQSLHLSRGAAAVQSADLAAGPRTDLWVELCGDAHLGNFRWFNCPDRKPVFDLDDFDETLPGPFEWDVKRLAASITVAARINGFPTKIVPSGYGSSDKRVSGIHHCRVRTQPARPLLLPLPIRRRSGKSCPTRQQAPPVEKKRARQGCSQE